jgi:hypothetical protein
MFWEEELVNSGVRQVKWMHDDSARPLWSSRERAAAVTHMTHTPMVSSKPDDKMTKSEGPSTRRARQLGTGFRVSTIGGLVLVIAGGARRLAL